MKRRVFTLLLAVVLVLSMVPFTAFASEPGREVSDSCVSMIKYFEGFHAKPYWDYSQYTVGYGTRCPDDKLTVHCIIPPTAVYESAKFKVQSY